MSDLPEDVMVMFAEVARSFTEDINEATKEAVNRLKKMDCYKKLVDSLIFDAVRNQIYSVRSQDNRKKRGQPPYISSPKRDIPTNAPPVSQSVMEAYESVYGYFLAGRTLGEIYGSELVAIGEKSKNLAKGHEFDWKLCEELREVVPAGVKVKQAIKEKKLRQIFDSLREKVKKESEAA